MGFCSQRYGSSSFWHIRLNNNALEIATGDSAISISNAWNPADATWYHVAIVKNGTSYLMFINGTQIGTTQTSTGVFQDVAAVMRIGLSGTSNYLNGWIDEFRVSKGIARWTANFTPPTAEYASTLISKVAGVLIASISKISGIAKASIKKIAGLG
jgi:hypothetical protein